MPLALPPGGGLSQWSAVAAWYRSTTPAGMRRSLTAMPWSFALRRAHKTFWYFPDAWHRSRLPDQFGETVSSALLVARHDMPVDGQRDGDTGWPSRSLTILTGSPADATRGSHSASRPS